MVDRAYEHRLAINVSLKDFLRWILTGDIRLDAPIDKQNTVRVENPHFYPDLLRMAFQTAGYKRNVEDEVRRIVKHEMQHLIPIIGFPKIHTSLSVSFYRPRIFPRANIISAAMIHSDNLTREQEIDALTNVDYLGADDKADLQQMLRFGNELP